MLRAIGTSPGSLDNLSSMVGVIDSISSGAAVAENAGLCWPRWHVAIGLAATPRQWFKLKYCRRSSDGAQLF
jgi:hypothetical protein